MRGTYVDQPRLVALASAGGWQQQRELARPRTRAHTRALTRMIRRIRPAGDRSIPFSTLAPAFGSSGQAWNTRSSAGAVQRSGFSGPQGRLQGDAGEAPLEVGHESRGATASQEFRRGFAGSCLGPPEAQVQGLDEISLRLILDSGVGIQLGPIALEESGVSLEGLCECLAVAAPESLQLRGVPWELLSGADWPQLKKADFAQHLGQHTSELFSFGFLRDPPPRSPLRCERAEVFPEERRGHRGPARGLGPLPGVRGATLSRVFSHFAVPWAVDSGTAGGL